MALMSVSSSPCPEDVVDGVEDAAADADAVDGVAEDAGRGAGASM